MAHNVYGAPYLDSYAKALAHYDAVKPIRGSKVVIKPIGVRRYHGGGEIKKLGDAIHLMFERRKLVEWRPDNTFTLHAPHYYHAFQAEKLNGWMPYGFYFTWDHKRLFVCSRDGEKILLPHNGKLEFALTDGSPKFRCVDKVAPVEYKARRMAADKLVRQHFEPFLAWARVVLGESYKSLQSDLTKSHDRFLLEIGYPPELIAQHERILDTLQNDSEWRPKLHRFIYALNRIPFTTAPSRSQWYSRRGCEHLFKLLTAGDYSLWPYALDLITRQGGRFWWRANASANYTLTSELLEDYLKHLVSFLYRDEVFVVKPVEAGVIPSARNAEYFVELEHAF